MATTDIESLSIELYLLFMYQITTQQWFNIVTKLLGIRSCSYEEIKNNDYIAASYSLNPDTSVITDFAVISNDFIVKLINTINLIISFNDSHERYLAIVSQSVGTSNEYYGCLPKCSHKPTCCWGYTPILNKNTDELIEWVISNIPG